MQHPPKIEPYWFTHPGTTWASLLQAMWSSQSTARPEPTISSANSPGLIRMIYNHWSAKYHFTRYKSVSNQVQGKPTGWRAFPPPSSRNQRSAPVPALTIEMFKQTHISGWTNQLNICWSYNPMCFQYDLYKHCLLFHINAWWKTSMSLIY